jgi:hypothetical protein
MHPNLVALFHLRQVLRSVDGLPEARRIVVLEIELLHALKRASHSQRRNQLLERELEQLHARTPVRRHESHAHDAELERQLREARRELAKSKAVGQEQLRAMRLEVLAMELQCETLEELCRSLLLTIEHAACSELGAATEPGRKAGVSA